MLYILHGPLGDTNTQDATLHTRMAQRSLSVLSEVGASPLHALLLLIAIESAMQIWSPYDLKLSFTVYILAPPVYHKWAIFAFFRFFFLNPFEQGWRE